MCRKRIEERASRLSSGLSMSPRDARGDGFDDDPRDWETF